jgi:hypothetical protein
MSAHNVNHNISSEPAEVVGADNGVDGTVLTHPYVVRPRLVIQQVILELSVQCSFHVGDKACQGEALLLGVFHHRFEDSQRLVLVKHPLQR